MAATDPLGVKRCTAWLQCCSVFILKVKFKGRSVWVKKNRLLHPYFSACLKVFLSRCRRRLSKAQLLLAQRLRENLQVFCVTLLRAYIGTGCQPRLTADAPQTCAPRPWFHFMVSREPRERCPFLRWNKGQQNMKSQRSFCLKACDLFMAFRFTLSDVGSCETEH